MLICSMLYSGISQEVVHQNAFGLIPSSLQGNHIRSLFIDDTFFIIKDTLHIPNMPMVGQLSKDGLEIYFSYGDFFITDHSIYKMSRSRLQDTFSIMTLAIDTTKITAPATIMPSVTANRETMIFVSTMEMWDFNDLHIAYKGNGRGLFDSSYFLSELCDSLRAEAYPWISPDGKSIYFTRGYGFERDSLFYATRESVNDSFSEAKSLSLNTKHGNISCWLTDDEKEIYFFRRNEDLSTTLHYAQRKIVSEQFSNPKPLLAIEGTFLFGFCMIQNEVYVWAATEEGSYIIKLRKIKDIPIVTSFINYYHAKVQKANIENDNVFIYNLLGKRIPIHLFHSQKSNKISQGMYVIQPSLIKPKKVYLIGE